MYQKKIALMISTLRMTIKKVKTAASNLLNRRQAKGLYPPLKSILMIFIKRRRKDTK